MTGKLFVEGGYQWSAVPPISMLPWSRARHLWEHLVESVHDSGERVALFTRRIAQALGVSMRYVQYAIRDLIDLGFVTIREERAVLPDGRVMIRRVMTLIQRPAGKPPKPKRPAGLATKPASKIFSPVDERAFVDPRTDVRRPLLFEEESQLKDEQTPPGGESDGTDPPGGLGADIAEAAFAPELEAAAAADPLATMMAAAATVAPLAAPVPVKTPTAPAVASPRRKPVAEALAERKRRAEPLAQAGDRVAMAELAEIDQALRALADRGPAPPSMPPPQPIEPPRSDARPDPPVTFGRSLASWLRKLLE